MTAWQTLQRQTIEPLTFVNMFLIIWNVIDYLAGRHYLTVEVILLLVFLVHCFSHDTAGRSPIKSDLSSSLMRNKDTLLRFCESCSLFFKMIIKLSPP